MKDIVAIDLGGTHARFAGARLMPGARPEIGAAARYRTEEFDGLPSVWRRFRKEHPEISADAAAISVAAPIDGGLIRFTNSRWTIDPDHIGGALGLSSVLLLNDFGAAAHAVAVMRPDELVPVAGPMDAVPDQGMTTVIGPGTGLGVGQLLRRGHCVHVIETEGGHGDFAPLDAVEEGIESHLRARFGRVSTERLVSGPGLANIHAALGGASSGDAALWQAALDRTDPLAEQALDRLVASFGSVLGDLTLAHGSNRVVIVGGLANRMIEHLRRPLFHARFCAKGRYTQRMGRIPIQLATTEQPGLLGAAAAFARAKAA